MMPRKRTFEGFRICWTERKDRATMNSRKIELAHLHTLRINFRTDFCKLCFALSLVNSDNHINEKINK